MATLGWIDFSKEYRQKVGTILELLKPEGMVDELGIGTIRDAIANQLFPGISTIQTRAKYFFIVPYILYDYLAEDKTKRKRIPVTKYLDDREHEVIWELAERYNYDRSSGHGVIGISKKRPERIMRRPSEIYWGGLNTYNIINTGGYGVNAFLSNRKNSLLESLIANVAESDDSYGDDKDADYENEFRIMISPNPSWRDSLSLELTEEEADILKNRIIDIASDQLVGELLSKNKLFDLFRSTDEFMDFSKVVTDSLVVSEDLQRDLIIAHDFSEMMYGANIVYNYLIQKYRFEKDYWLDEWDEWLDNLSIEMISFDSFDPSMLFRPPFSLTTKTETQQFVLRYWSLVKSNQRDIESYSELVINQEYNTKKYKARLRLGKLDDVKEDHWIGLQRLSYRYKNAKVILGDIFNGLGI